MASLSRLLSWPLIRPSLLRNKGILGLNQRNHSYISRYNPRSLYPLVDNKLKTKLLAHQAQQVVPELLGVIRHQHDINTMETLLQAQNGFVIKPAKGSGGKGILVITQNEGGRFYKASGNEESLASIKRHTSNILAGLYSLGGSNDQAIIEDLIRFDSCFEGFSFEGVPDIRVIVFKGYPIMAMMRLSTAASDGKANLHQGAVGVGICLQTGKAINAVQYDQIIEHHPDTGKRLSELQVPKWKKLLQLAASCYEMSGLGYLGTDMVIDSLNGPMLLELNARPGLAIQLANNQGLLPRLKHIESLKHNTMSVNQRVDYCQTNFI